jgi:hypothetical protein
MWIRFKDFIKKVTWYVPGVKRSRRKRLLRRKLLNERRWHTIAALREAILQSPDCTWGHGVNQARQDDKTRKILKAIYATDKGDANGDQQEWSFDLPDLGQGLKQAQCTHRAEFLYKLEHGRRPAQPDNVDAALVANALAHFYQTKGGKIYLRDGSQNSKEALGFIKDWVTSLITIDTAAIGAMGAFIGFKDFPNVFISTHALLPLLPAAVAFTVSIVFGVFTLNALPGAIQRFPVDAVTLGSDVFSIANERRNSTLNMYSYLVRWPFVIGVGCVALFIIVQMFAVKGEPPQPQEPQIAELAKASAAAIVEAIQQQQTEFRQEQQRFQQSENEVAAILNELVAIQSKRIPAPGLPQAKRSETSTVHPPSSGSSRHQP